MMETVAQLGRPLGALLALLLASACGGVPTPVRRAYTDLTVDPARCREPSAARVTPAAMRADLGVLERVFRRGYAGFEYVATQNEWDRAFATAREAVPDEPVSARAFRDFLVARFAFLNDNHVGFSIRDAAGRRRWRSTSAHEQAWIAAARFRWRDGPDGGAWVDEAGRVLLGCEAHGAADVLQPVAGDALPEVRWAPVLLRRERPAPLACALRTPAGATEEVTLELARLELSDGRGPFFERREAPFAWLRLRTLFVNRRDAIQRFVESAATVRDAPVVVLDVRGVGGGADRYLNRWFRDLTSEELRYWETDALRSEVTLQGALNFWECVRAGVDSDAGGASWLDARVARARREVDEAMRERGPFRDRERQHLPIPGRAPAPFGGRLVVLVDRGCASACETSVLLARQIPGALVVGENTEGSMKVGELARYRLPHSGVRVSAGRRVHRDPSYPGGFPEGRGYLPDLWLDGTDVEGHLRRLAACLGDAACAARLDAALERRAPGASE
jgi:hypothetical protein